MWSFNRIRDSSQIESRQIIWKGPFSWPKYQLKNNLPEMPDIEGLYLISFQYNDGFITYSVGITNSTKRRIAAHTRAYKKGEYTVLDTKSAGNGVRKEIWHGWQYAKDHEDEYSARKDTINEAVEKQLCSFRIFIAEMPDKRLRERLEAGIMHNIYIAKEPWADLADRGMHLKGRTNFEMPISAENISQSIIYGLPKIIEI